MKTWTIGDPLNVRVTMYEVGDNPPFRCHKANMEAMRGEVEYKAASIFIDCVHIYGVLYGLPLGLFAAARVRALGRKAIRDIEKRKATK